MKIRAQVGMVLNLDKCIGCHTCSVTCKNVWTSREGIEYAWFNNVETKPGIGYPNEWETQSLWRGGWVLDDNGDLVPNIGGKLTILSKILSNPHLPSIDDYYEPFTFDYGFLQNAPFLKFTPVARPVSIITGKYMDIKTGPNWEEILGGEFSKRSKDYNFKNIEKNIYGEFKNTFMIYLPRLCEHCLNPACVAVCPASAIYKREEDGIVLVDQNKCRGWRMCISGCPYKKVYYNWKSGKSEKCTFCYPRIESGLTTVCSETCVGRIRYVGIILYDADKIYDISSIKNEKELYEKQLDIFLDPNNLEVIKEAKKANISDDWIKAAQDSPIYKMAVNWKIAFPLHPEYRTLPMVWYIPPLSPIQNLIKLNNEESMFPEVNSLRIPVQYLANLLTGGKVEPIVEALEKMIAMRVYMRSKIVDNLDNMEVLKKVKLSKNQVEEMYRYMAIANYEDRFVVPSGKPELFVDDSFAFRSGLGFCPEGENSQKINLSLFSKRKNLFGGD